MEDIKAELREERSMRKRAEAKARNLDQQLPLSTAFYTSHPLRTNCSRVPTLL